MVQKWCKMAQLGEYIEYQEVIPPVLQHEPVQDRCKSGAKDGAELTTIKEERGLVDWEKWHKAWHRSRPARKVVGKITWFVVKVGAGVCVGGYVVYRIGLAVAELFAAIGSAVVDAAPFIVRGGLFCLFVVVLVYVVLNTRRATPFEDWKRTPKPNKDSQTTTENRTIVINQVVNISEK